MVFRGGMRVNIHGACSAPEGGELAKFYQPAETQGIYDAAANRLTVNQLDRVLIGVQAINPQELQGFDIGATENVITARYAVSSTRIELDIDTKSPAEFKITATQDVAMSAIPKNVIKPLEVVVRPLTYVGKPAVGQERDPAGCWAACLSYFLSITPGRDARRFADVLGDFNGVWDRTGFLNVDSLRRQLVAQNKRYRMTTEKLAPDTLDKLIGRWPILIGFKHPGGFGHMNVLTTFGDGMVRAMDPWSPDPGPNSLMREPESGQVIFNTNVAETFKFTGIFAMRPLNYYKSAMKSGTIFVGYPQEYQNRMH